MKILESRWFTEMGSTESIGIVITLEKGRKKAFIGTAFFENQDEQVIADSGAHFPLDAAEALMKSKDLG